MKIIEQYHDVPADQQNCSLAIGNFDGVHKGHQVVLEAAMSVAQKNKICAGVMVFEPHPRVFFQPQRHLFRLTSPKPSSNCSKRSVSTWLPSCRLMRPWQG